MPLRSGRAKLFPALLLAGLALSGPAAADPPAASPVPAHHAMSTAPDAAKSDADGQTAYEKQYYADPFYHDITQAALVRGPRDMIAWLDEQIEENPARINSASLWLRDNSMGQRDLTKVNALYFMAYSDVMTQLAAAYGQAGQAETYRDMVKTALMALYAYDLMANVDAARCADPTVVPIVRQRLFGRYDRFTDAFRLLSKSDFNYFATSAFIADRKFEKRLPNEYICDMGDAKMNDMLRQPGVRTQTIDDPNRPGLTATEILPPQGYKYTPTYVDDTDWAKRRVAMRKEVEGIWEKRYERLSVSTGPAAIVPAPHPAPDPAAVGDSPNMNTLKIDNK